MATLATDAGMAIAFLRHLFKPYQDGFIEIRPLSKVKPHANRTTYRLPHCLRGDEGQALTQHIISLAIRGYDVYCGVCPRAAPEGPGRKLGKDSIEQLYKLLNRSLNCNPEAPKTWFELSDVLEKVLR